MIYVEQQLVVEMS